jgi:hypothetical protein
MDCSNKMLRIFCPMLINFVTFIISWIAFPDEIDCIKPVSSMRLFAGVVTCYLCFLFWGIVICTPRNASPHIRYVYFMITFSSFLAQFGVVISTFLALIQDRVITCENPPFDMVMISNAFFASLSVVGILGVTTTAAHIADNSSDEV